MFIHNINPTLFKIWGLEIRYYGIIYALGFIIAYFMIDYLARKKEIKLTKDDSADLIVYLVLGTIIGARLFFVLFCHLFDQLFDLIYFFVQQAYLDLNHGIVQGHFVVIFVVYFVG